MSRPNLNGLIYWVGETLLDQVDNRRKAEGEMHRERKLGTAQTLWLMLAVALNTGSRSLHEILRLTTADLGIPWEVTTGAFCKARKRFSPPPSAIPAWPPGVEAVPAAGAESGTVEGAHCQGG